MDNKNNKTFADLFSTAKIETGDEEITKTFSDILNNAIGGQEDSSFSPITFDSLSTESSIKEKKEQEKILEEENKTNNIEKLNQEIFKDYHEPVLEKNKKESEETIFQQNQSPIFSIDNNTELNNDAQSETLNITNKIKNNIFFDELPNEIAPLEEQNNTLIENKNQVTESDLKHETITENIIKNPFLTISDDKDNSPFFSKESPTNSTSKEEVIEDKVSIATKSNEELFPTSKESSPSKSIFDSDISSKFSNLDETKSSNNISNSFINNQEEEQNNIQETMSPANKNLEEANTSPLSTEIVPSNNDKEKVIKEETPENISLKSTSPFFNEEIKKEENPLFQTKINLIENKQPTEITGNIDLSKAKHYKVKITKKKEPLIKMILGILSYALFIFLLLIGVTLLAYVLDIKIRAAKGDTSSPTFNAYVVLTGSMLPEIQVYDVVITKKVEPEKLKEGDVITFASADSRFLGTIITHRIIKKNPKTEESGYTFQTKGDNNNVADNALVPEQNIFGKVILKIPKLGYLQEFLATDGGWIIVILIPCLVVISYDIVKLIKGLKRKKYKNIKVQK